MNDKDLSKLNWRRALTALAIGFGTVGYLDSGASATPIKNNFQLAQVGVRSRITTPIPLNLRPRTHTPLPRSNSSYYPSHSYPRRNSSYGSHHKYDHHHGNYNHRHHGDTRKNRRRTGGTVIIINPGNHRGYGNYSNSGSYIRVLRK